MPVIRVIIKLAEDPAVVLIDERAGRRTRSQLRLKRTEAEFGVQQIRDVQQDHCAKCAEAEHGIRLSQ